MARNKYECLVQPGQIADVVSRGHVRCKNKDCPRWEKGRRPITRELSEGRIQVYECVKMVVRDGIDVCVEEK